MLRRSSKLPHCDPRPSERLTWRSAAACLAYEPQNASGPGPRPAELIHPLKQQQQILAWPLCARLGLGTESRNWDALALGFRTLRVQRGGCRHGPLCPYCSVLRWSELRKRVHTGRSEMLLSGAQGKISGRSGPERETGRTEGQPPGVQHGTHILQAASLGEVEGRT